MSDPTPLIVSPDTRRANRLPPRQALTRKWPVLHAGGVPRFDRARWTFHVFGLVEQPWQCTYDEFLSLPRVRVTAESIPRPNRTRTPTPIQCAGM